MKSDKKFCFSSVVAIKGIKKGDKFSRDNIWIKDRNGLNQ